MRIVTLFLDTYQEMSPIADGDGDGLGILGLGEVIG